ncbi:MAG: hypothetical protein ACI3V2_05055 [Faecousia sp.]
MKLEQPRIPTNGDLSERVAYLERYLYRLTSELQMALNTIESRAKRGDCEQ